MLVRLKLVCDSSSEAYEHACNGGANKIHEKGAFRNNVIKKVGRSGLEMITNCYMVDGWVLWMITLFYKIADF